MNKEEIENKIDAYDKIVEEIQAKIEEMQKLKAEIAQLTEAEKPKLSSGDVIEWVGENCSNKGVNVILGENPAKLSQYNLTDNSRGVTSDFPPDKFHRHFNILEQVADLEALKEPLEEFIVGDLEVSIDGDGDIKIYDSDDCTAVYVKKRDIHDFILNLRKLEIKMLLDAAKGEVEGEVEGEVG